MKIKDLILSLSSNSWEKSLKASDELVNHASEDVVDLLMDVLDKSSSANAVNSAALALREIGNNKAVPSILNAIKNPKNSQNRSTLVYALESLDCRKFFIDIFPLFVLSNKWDVMFIPPQNVKTRNFKI